MLYSDAHTEPHMFCYTLTHMMPYDPELIWALVQRHQGHIACLPGGRYDFHIVKAYASILVMAYPLLQRQYQRDLYV